MLPAHIHAYVSKLRLSLETDDETNELYLQRVSYIPGHDPRCFGADPEPAARQTGSGSYIMLIQEYNRR